MFLGGRGGAAAGPPAAAASRPASRRGRCRPVGALPPLAARQGAATAIQAAASPTARGEREDAVAINEAREAAVTLAAYLTNGGADTSLVAQLQVVMGVSPASG